MRATANSGERGNVRLGVTFVGHGLRGESGGVQSGSTSAGRGIGGVKLRVTFVGLGLHAESGEVTDEGRAGVHPTWKNRLDAKCIEFVGFWAPGKHREPGGVTCGVKLVAWRSVNMRQLSQPARRNTE